MGRSKVAIIIPAFNEEKSIARVVSNSLQYGQVIVVDDSSDDRTFYYAKLAGAIVLRKNAARGYDSSLELGFSYAAALGFEVVVTIDADGQHDPIYIPMYIDKIKNGSDVVVGIRDSVSRIGEKLFCYLGAKILGVQDPLCGFKAYKLEVYCNQGYFDSYQSIGTELLINSSVRKKKISEIPISISKRKDSPRFGNIFQANVMIFRSILLGYLNTLGLSLYVKNEIFVTRPYLPPLEEFIPYLEEIWRSRILTNNGPFHERLESELEAFLGVKHVSLFSNATKALEVAVRVLELEGQVITTPYSFVATSHALAWRGVKPIFADISLKNLNIDPDRVESLINKNTTAIMAVHTYGNPCDLDALKSIADRYGLKIIYDAAHAFGVELNGESILCYGNLSVLSFHATKVFNTFEGGAIISHDYETKRKIDQFKNFGYTNEVSVDYVGTNGKMSEFNAALGILQLKKYEEVRERRRRVDSYYRFSLKNVPGVDCLKYPLGLNPNYAYFPIFIRDEYIFSRDQLYDKLKSYGVNARRYFYPLIPDFKAYRINNCNQEFGLNNARDIASRVLCLPIYPEITKDELDLIVKVISDL